MVIELQRTGSIILAILLPVLIVIVSLFIHFLSKRSKNYRISRITKFMIEPIQFRPILNNPEIYDLSATESRKILRKEILSRAFLVYFVIGIFIFSSFLGELYQVLSDRTLLIIFARIIDGTSPPPEVWSAVVIESPFSSGFRGFQTWYDTYPNPILTSDYYHRTWEWIFYTSALYNNLFVNMQYQIFGDGANTLVYGFSSLMIIVTLFIGGIFLSQLSWKQIRQSFLASIFFFEAGMIIGTKGIFSCFAQAWQIEVNGISLQYGAYVISRTTIAAQWVILGLLPVIVGLLFLFLWIGKKIWQIHYSETKSISKRVFLVSIGINYFVALLILLFV